MLRGSFPSAGKKSGVIWCLGGAIINKSIFAHESVEKTVRVRRFGTLIQDS